MVRENKKEGLANIVRELETIQLKLGKAANRARGIEQGMYVDVKDAVKESINRAYALLDYIETEER